MANEAQVPTTLIRPRRERRGSRAERRAAAIYAIEASIRPRREHRGSLEHCLASQPNPPPLQFYGQNDTLTLQFGHGADAVDHARLHVCTVMAGRGFNSATARAPWITSPVPRPPGDAIGRFNSATARDAVETPCCAMAGHAGRGRASIRPRR